MRILESEDISQRSSRAQRSRDAALAAKHHDAKARGCVLCGRKGAGLRTTDHHEAVCPGCMAEMQGQAVSHRG